MSYRRFKFEGIPVATIATVATERPSEVASVATVASVAATHPEEIAFDERAAIVEFDGGVPREWAEGFARLLSSRPPTGFTTERWQVLLDDGGRFLDRWAAAAIACGWSTLDVFGLNPSAPAARYDGMGLVPLIAGGDVIAITSDHATIKMSSGACLTYYLRRPRPDAVAAWELLDRPPK